MSPPLYPLAFAAAATCLPPAAQAGDTQAWIESQRAGWNIPGDDSFSIPAELGWERMRLRLEAGFDGQIDALVLDDAAHPQPQRFARQPGQAPRKSP